MIKGMESIEVIPWNLDRISKMTGITPAYDQSRQWKMSSMSDDLDEWEYACGIMWGVLEL